MTKKLLITTACLFIMATLLPLLRSTAWWIRAFDFPRMQLALGGIALLIAYVWAWDVRRVSEGAVLTLLLFCVLYQSWRILPYTPLVSPQVIAADRVDAENTLSVLVANVLMHHDDASRLVDMVERWDPDLILAVETDAAWIERLRPVEAERPQQVKVPLDNTYGMALYSRFPLIDPKVEYLLEEDVPSIHTQIRLPSGRLIWFHGLHPRPPAPAESTDTKERDAELLIVARRVASRDEPTVVTGDLNDVAWSSTTSLMQRLSGLLDPRIGRGLYSTFHAKVPIIRWPLDHIFHSDHFKLGRLERLPKFGSDHLPIFGEFVLDPLAPHQQEEPEATTEDVERAEEKIIEGLVDEAQEKAAEKAEEEAEQAEEAAEGDGSR